METVMELGSTTLDELIKNGTIKSYRYINVSSDGIENEKSEFRNTERLILEFTNGKILAIDCMCSGCDQNTSLWCSVDDENTSNTVLLIKNFPINLLGN